jgi:protein-tyrosine phosphatase
MLDSSAPEFAAAARAVATAVAARAPLLFFCRVGKDRTGLLAALILALAGAPDAVIADDYAASDGTVAAVALGGLEKKDRELAGLDTSVFARAPAAAILAALDHVRTVHGGVEAYLESGGFTRGEQAALVAGLQPREERSTL